MDILYKQLPSDENLIFISAFENETSVGTAAAQLNSTHLLAELKNIDGKTTEINEGLLQTLEFELGKWGCRLLFANFQKSAPLDQLLHACKWEGPKRISLEYHFDATAFSPPWLKKPYKMPKNFTIFPWDKLKKKERESLQEERISQKIPDEVYPYTQKCFFQPSNSLGLRHEGRIIGWCLTESFTPGVLKYSKLYVAPPYRRSGVGILLLIESIRRHNSKIFPQAFFKINLEHSSMRWLRFLKKRLIPYAYSSTEYQQMWKQLIL